MKLRPIDIVVLAGGFGTRLRSMVSDRPKALAPIGERYFLDFVMDGFKQSFVKRWIFCLYYMADQIKQHAQDVLSSQMDVLCVTEPEPRDTAGALAFLPGDLSDHFCLINADTIADIDIEQLYRCHLEQDAVFTIGMMKVTDGSRYGRVELNEHGYVTALHEKDSSYTNECWVSAGVYFVSKEALNLIRGDQKMSLEKELVPQLIQQGSNVYGAKIVNDFIDIGIPETYQQFLEKNSKQV